MDDDGHHDIPLPDGDEDRHDYYDLVEVPRGRPRKQLNKYGVKMVIKLAKIGMNVKEICDYMEMDDKTIYSPHNRKLFSDAYEKGHSELNHNLRAAMVKKAVTDGNPTMQIFLAKNLLGMADNPMQVSEEVSPMDDFAKTFAKTERRLKKQAEADDDDPSSD